VDPASANADDDKCVIALTTLAGAGRMPSPLPLDTVVGVFLPVIETRTMTRTANTTSTVPKAPAVTAVLPLGAFFAGPRREGISPILVLPASHASASPRLARRSRAPSAATSFSPSSASGRSSFSGALPPFGDWPRRGGRLPLWDIAACSPR